MNIKPLYTPQSLRQPAYQIRYTFSAWPSQSTFPPEPPAPFLEELAAHWEGDGIRKLEYRWTPDIIQFTFSTKPQVAPSLLASRAKGRLEYALRQAGQLVKFSRKVAVGTIGHNTQADVESYIERQVPKEQLVDKKFERKMLQFTFADPTVDLTVPTPSKRGRYWYNLHLVLVVCDRWRISDVSIFKRVYEQCFRIAAVHGYQISRLSLLPDHLHTSLRGNIEHSPEVIALKFLNNIAYAIGQRMLYEPCYYAGTFGPYNMNALRCRPE